MSYQNICPVVTLSKILIEILSLLSVILLGVLLPITFILGGVITFYHCYKKKKCQNTASDENKNTPNKVIPQAQLENIINELEDAILDHSSLNPILKNCNSLEKTWDVFISYRRSNGSLLASLLRNNLEARKFSVFLDVDRYNK